MKKIFFVLLSCLAVYGLAQDTLYFKQQPKMNVAVKEVTPTEIKYQKTDNPDGPVYVVAKTEVEKLVYKNGQSETFTVNTSPPTKESLISIEIDPKLYQVRNRTVYDGKIIIDEDYNVLLNNYKNKTIKPILIKNYNEEVDFKKRSTRKFWSTLIAVGVGGLLTEGISNQFYNEPKVSYNTGVITSTKPDNTKYNVIHTTMFLGLVAAPATLGFTYSYVLKNKAKAIRKKTIEYYNFNLMVKDSVKVKPDTSLNSITNPLIQVQNEQLATPVIPTTIAKIRLLGAKRYTEDKKTITERTFKQRLDAYPNTTKKIELLNLYEIKQKYSIRKKTCFTVAPVCLGVGALLSAFTILGKSSNAEIIGNSITMGVVAAVPFALGINYKLKETKQKEKLLKLYNNEN